MTTYETSDLHKRVGRYEAALEELRTAHQDVRHILHDQVLYDRWQQIGIELGFVAGATVPESAIAAPADMPAPAQPVPQLADSWVS
jgi:hypothetical protein